MNTDMEARRSRRRERILRDIASLRASRDGEAMFLRPSQIAAVAERISYAVGDDFSLTQLEAIIRNIFVQSPSLRMTQGEMRAQARSAIAPNSDSPEALKRMTADQRLALGNERERLKRLEAVRQRELNDEC